MAVGDCTTRLGPGGFHLRPWWSLHARDLGVCVWVSVWCLGCRSAALRTTSCLVRHALYVTDAGRASDAGGVRGGEPRVFDRMIPTFHPYLATWSQLRGSSLTILLSVCLLPSFIGQDQSIALAMSHRVNDVPTPRRPIKMKARGCCCKREERSWSLLTNQTWTHGGVSVEECVCMRIPYFRNPPHL